MSDYVTVGGTSPLGQHVEYRQYPGGGYSLAESRAKVFVSGKCVVSGWSSDGTTYSAYVRALTLGWEAFEPCTCRDCQDVSYTAPKGGWTLCRECLDAGCTPVGHTVGVIQHPCERPKGTAS